jgi:hypothetical protein
MYIDDMHSGIVLQVFGKMGDVYVHAAGREKNIIPPDLYQCQFAVENLVLMFAYLAATVESSTSCPFYLMDDTLINMTPWLRTIVENESV